MQNSLNHQEYLRKRRNKKLFRYGLAVFLLIIVIAILSYLSHLPNARIVKARLSGEVVLSQEEVSKEALSFISGSYLWLFPKNNAFLYPRKSLKKHLAETFRRIDTVEVNINGLTELTVVLSERKPVSLWCDKFSPNESATDREGGSAEDSSPKCYFMDKDGFVFSKAPNFSGNAYFKYYGLVQSDNPIGKYYLASTTEFTQMVNFVNKSQQSSINPLYIIANDNGEFTLVLHGGGKIYFDTKESISKTTDNLEALLRAPALKIAPNQDLPVEYVDLRFGNKLFYKLKTN